MDDLAPDYRLSSYRFPLPEKAIAQHPAPTRTASRLMLLDRATGQRRITSFDDIIANLPENCLLLANNSTVIPARLTGYRQSGGKVEFLLLTPPPLLQKKTHPVANGKAPQSAIAEGLLRSGKQLRPNEKIIFSPDMSLTLMEYHDFGKCTVLLEWQGDLLNALQKLGTLPLPPYIKRPGKTLFPESKIGLQSGTQQQQDLERYQTVYADGGKAGSVAAPTAGLHFTPELIKSITTTGRIWAEAALYVGYGTFSPVRCEDIRNHTMHAEYVELSAATANLINQAITENRPIIAVGTTSTRILEGLIRTQHPHLATQQPATRQVNKPQIQPYQGWINLFLYPGTPFHLIDGLITNFHLPESSLVMLVSAFAGRTAILDAYAHALQEDFRFFSYGDAMLIL